jgi:hypothetical protein
VGKSAQVKSSEKFRIVSGIPFPVEWPDLFCQLQLFLNAPKFQLEPENIIIRGQQYVYSGTGRFEHSRNISKILWPKSFQWHDWSEKVDRKACETSSLSSNGLFCATGCGASSKSTTLGGYALKFWMAAPLDTAVLMASKTIDNSKKRIWREVARLYSGFSSLVGGYKDATIGSSPRPSICPVMGADRKKDESHGLFVVAMHGKDLEKEVEFLKGFHVRRILVIADELDSLEEGGEALVKTFNDNLSTGTYEAQFVGLGNDPSLFNALGDMMQPEIGKPVGLNHKDWISAKGVNCLRLDAWDSPNLVHPDKFTGLVGQKDIDRITKNGVELNSPSVWIQLHGLHPPEGCSNTVLSEATLLRFHAFESVTWKSGFTLCAALDPAFGGDACIFRTVKRGLDTHGNMKILCDEMLSLPIDARPQAPPADYQIAEKVKSLCKDRGIAPDEFILDATGIGRGVAAILEREWSGRIEKCVFGGACSERIISEENPVPANKEYDRFVTELWFAAREYTEADMIRGLDLKTSVQLCSRTYEDKGAGSGRKLSIQKKEEMLHSPDEADALVTALELLRRKGVWPSITGVAKEETQKSVEKAMIDYDFDASPDAYSDPLLDRMEETFSF